MTSTYDIPVFIINMPNRPDRKKHMIKLMKDIGFTNYTFIVPYKADINTKRLFEKLLGRRTQLPLTKISHNMTYLDILRYDTDKMIILEDDIIPTKSLTNIKKDLDTIIWTSPSDAVMIYLEMCYEKCSFIKNPSTTKFIKLENPNCAASIYYPNKSLRNKLYTSLISYNNTLYMNAIDEEFRNIIKKYGISVYILNILFIQDERFGSDLEGSIGYNLQRKPVLPICDTYKKSIDYISTDNEIDKNIKNKFIQNNDSFEDFEDIDINEGFSAQHKRIGYYRYYKIFAISMILVVLIYMCLKTLRQ